ncbi:RRP12 [Mytilus edulis]|uniref:RRP12 n=1 Tax=Mytilus edulis TaxID=6550 RepID=A0A8S3RMX7_MYTED|nr:RRP12 [Mytilus edulis]
MLRNSIFQPMSAGSAGTSGLTVDALAKHDEDHFSKDTDSLQEGFEKLSTSDKLSVGAKTFNTWATNYTECTNVTFNKVHRYWSSNSALHKEVIAILAAVTEVIKTNDGNETETEYFAALMTALDTTDDIESQAAILYLLSLVIKRVPVAVLRSKFAEVSKKFLDLLAANVDGGSTALVKSLLLSLAGVLRVQDQASWSNTSVQRVYSGLLTFITHKKPKVNIQYSSFLKLTGVTHQYREFIVVYSHL